MIHFYDDLVFKTLDEVKSAYDCADVSHDLMRIRGAMTNAKHGDWITGQALDQQLRLKYPCINHMDRLTSTRSASTPQSQKLSDCEIVFSNLNEDYYGILCDTAIKKGIIHNIKEFIKSVD